MSWCWVSGRNLQRSLVMRTTSCLPGRCMPPLRCQRHAAGQKGMTMTTHHYQHTQPPIPDQPYHLVGSMAELWQVMEPLVSFVEEVFTAAVPSIWMEVRLPRLMEPTPWDLLTVTAIAGATGPTQRGSLSVAHGESQPTNTVKTDTQATLPWEVMQWQMEVQLQAPMPLPGFAEITQALWGERSVERSNISWGCPIQRSWGHIWGNGVLNNGGPTNPAPYLQGDVYWYADLHTEYCGPGAWPHGGWPPRCSFAGAFRLWLASCFTVNCPSHCLVTIHPLVCWPMLSSCMFTMMLQQAIFVTLLYSSFSVS